MLYGAKIFWSSTEAAPYPPLLVLDPSISLHAASADELLRMHAGLVTAGLLSKRVWVWPPFECSSRRAEPSREARHWTGTKDRNVLPFGGPGHLQCLDLTLTWNYCMEVRALVAVWLRAGLLKACRLVGSRATSAIRSAWVRLHIDCCLADRSRGVSSRAFGHRSAVLHRFLG